MVKDTYTFKNGYKVKISLTDNPLQIKYQFHNQDGDTIRVMENGFPTHVGERSELIVQIKKLVDNPDDVQIVVQKLQKIINLLQGEAEVKATQEKQEQDLLIRKKSHKAKKFMESLDNPLLYIGAISDWLTAGERINTLICFIAGCSQIILGEPISVIGYGESSSGKTFVQVVALSFLPEEFIIFEKQVSPAALFNRSRQDKFYYDGKIVVYGDMGGQNDRDNMQEALDLMKELQTEGKLSKPVSVMGSDNKWVVEDLELEGRPAPWYTTVPADIDGQELSRAILYSPRTDNRDVFNKRGRALSLKRGRTATKFNDIEKESEMIPYMVLHLREVMEDYIVIDPFYDIIADLLNESKFYKRDTEKYINLLNAITAINFYHNKKVVFSDGQKAVITSKNDVQLLLSLLQSYMPSIAVNIKPKSVEIYMVLRENIDDWKAVNGADVDGYDDRGFKVGVTVADYFERSDKSIPLSSLHKYFSDLREAGLITIVGKNNRANMYDIVKHDFHEAIVDLDFDDIIENVEYELGSEIADIVREDVVDDELDISNGHDLVEDAPW